MTIEIEELLANIKTPPFLAKTIYAPIRYVSTQGIKKMCPQKAHSVFNQSLWLSLHDEQCKLFDYLSGTGQRLEGSLWVKIHLD